MTYPILVAALALSCALTFAAMLFAFYSNLAERRLEARAARLLGEVVDWKACAGGHFREIARLVSEAHDAANVVEAQAEELEAYRAELTPSVRYDIENLPERPVLVFAGGCWWDVAAFVNKNALILIILSRYEIEAWCERPISVTEVTAPETEFEIAANLSATGLKETVDAMRKMESTMAQFGKSESNCVGCGRCDGDCCE